MYDLNGASVVEVDAAMQLDATELGQSHVRETAGWGACSADGCECQSFMGNAYELCQNCKHNYDFH